MIIQRKGIQDILIYLVITRYDNFDAVGFTENTIHGFELFIKYICDVFATAPFYVYCDKTIRNDYDTRG